MTSVLPAFQRENMHVRETLPRIPYQHKQLCNNRVLPKGLFIPYSYFYRCQDGSPRKPGLAQPLLMLKQ